MKMKKTITISFEEKNLEKLQNFTEEMGYELKDFIRFSATKTMNEMKPIPSRLQVMEKTFCSCAEHLHPHLIEFASKEQEHFIVISLNTKNQIISKDVISIGTVDSASVHPRDVFRNAIRNNATRIIVAHNHPTGQTEPSITDNKLTQLLVDNGKMLMIPVLDHLIIGDGFYSYRNQSHGINW
jgi:DNA repair protein RadC